MTSAADCNLRIKSVTKYPTLSQDFQNWEFSVETLAGQDFCRDCRDFVKIVKIYVDSLRNLNFFNLNSTKSLNELRNLYKIYAKIDLVLNCDQDKLLRNTKISRSLHWCQNKLFENVEIFSTVEIESLDQDHVKTNRDPPKA